MILHCMKALIGTYRNRQQTNYETRINREMVQNKMTSTIQPERSNLPKQSYILEDVSLTFLDIVAYCTSTL